MFHQGDIASGIASALDQQKLVLCFVCDANPQSSEWEGELHDNPEIAQELRRKAVALRIVAPSQEAEALAALCAIPSVPSALVFHNGNVIANLSADLPVTEFSEKLLHALRTEGSEEFEVPAEATTVPVSQPASIQTGQAEASEQRGQMAAPTSTASARVRGILEERRKRLEADKEAREAKEKAEKQAKAESRLSEAEKADPSSAKPKQLSYAQQQKKQQQEAKQERMRILNMIENDKKERKAREEMRKAATKAEGEASTGIGSTNNLPKVEQIAAKPKASRICALQVRLFDGSTIRTRFPSDITLREEVRPWIDSHGANDDRPYTFRQILAPQPNRAITIAEEDESLLSLGLTPSCNLVLVPVSNFSTAYEPNAGYIARGLSSGYNLLSGSVGLVGNAVGSLLSLGQGAASQSSVSEASPSSASGQESSAALNIRTLEDNRQRNDAQQLYNGNQLNFEPRRDSNDSTCDNQDDNKKDS